MGQYCNSGDTGELQRQEQHIFVLLVLERFQEAIQQISPCFFQDGITLPFPGLNISCLLCLFCFVLFCFWSDHLPVCAAPFWCSSQTFDLFLHSTESPWFPEKGSIGMGRCRLWEQHCCPSRWTQMNHLRGREGKFLRYSSLRMKEFGQREEQMCKVSMQMQLKLDGMAWSQLWLKHWSKALNVNSVQQCSWLNRQALNKLFA